MKRTAGLAALLFLALAAPATAQIVYTDKDGVTHFVDSPDQVPQEYRGGAVNANRGASPKPPMPGGPAPASPSSPHVLWESANGEVPKAKVRTFPTLNDCLAGLDNYDREMQQQLARAGGRFVIFSQVTTSLSYVCLPLGTNP